MTFLNQSLLKNLPSCWQRFFAHEMEKPYMQTLSHFLENQEKDAKVIFPHKHDIFRAFQYTSVANVRVVIIGQDPYHNKGQANGMAFSVAPDVKILPPSLQNILKQIRSDYPNTQIGNHGDLTEISKQGVLFLNSILTVEENKPGSHACLS